ncbi:MAG: glutaminase A [Sarcina sp.]
MNNLNNQLLEELIEKNKKFIGDGHVATYIPELSKINPNLFGVAVIDLSSGNEYTAGDYKEKFAIESISKILSLTLAIMDNGFDYVFNKIGIEPTHFAFNSILNMEIRNSKKPTNPFINAGAIAVTSLIKGDTAEEKITRLINFIKKLANNDDIEVNETLYLSEKNTGDQNRSLAFYMKAHEMIIGDVDDILDVYFKQCSIEVTALDLAKIASIYANNGYCPYSKKEVINKEICTTVKSLMTTCGLYDESGSFAVNIGIPSKSGVGGGIIASAPQKMGIGIFSPALDLAGNSIAGSNLLKDLSKTLDLNIFE